MKTLCYSILVLLSSTVSSLKFIEIPNFFETGDARRTKENGKDTLKPRTLDSLDPNELRRAFVRQEQVNDGLEAEKDESLKQKIAALVEQTIRDTDRKLRMMSSTKDKHKEQPAYKVGFILCLIKKSRDVMNELFNVAVKHKDEWKALEQLKIFELIVHTNVDTTNLVRQLVEIHVQSLHDSGVENKADMKFLYRRYLGSFITK